MQSVIETILSRLSCNSELLTHSINTASLCMKCLKELPKNYISLSPDNIYFAGLLHDIGKTTWDQEWFVKPKHNITKNEWIVMYNHPLEGARIAKDILPDIPKDIISLIATHHERPGGRGYPKGVMELSNETLLLAACDVFCACTEKRQYRSSRFHATNALDIVSEFAPTDIVRAIALTLDLFIEPEAVSG